MVARGHIAAARRFCRVVIVPSGWREDWTNPMFEGCQRDQPPPAPQSSRLRRFVHTACSVYPPLFLALLSTAGCKTRAADIGLTIHVRRYALTAAALARRLTVRITGVKATKCAPTPVGWANVYSRHLWRGEFPPRKKTYNPPSLSNQLIGFTCDQLSTCTPCVSQKNKASNYCPQLRRFSKFFHQRTRY